MKEFEYFGEWNPIKNNPVERGILRNLTDKIDEIGWWTGFELARAGTFTANPLGKFIRI